MSTRYPPSASALLWVLLCVCSAVAEPRPNFVVILADDMGFSDIGPYGSEIPTPSLDRLAAGGLCFSQFYNTGRCCPTRASLLTGHYSHRAGIGHMTADDRLPGYRGHLRQDCATFAEVLREAGYFTAMTGKWHVGHRPGQRPTDRGFRRSLNLAAGGVYYPCESSKCQLFLDGERIANVDPRLPENWYATDLWTDYGLKFVDEALSEGAPFLLYQAHTAPHFPLQADAIDIDRFRGNYRRGWEQLAQERLGRQRRSGLIDASWQPAPLPDEISRWVSLSDEEKDRFDHLMSVYAAVVARMDQSIGNLLKGLEDRGALDNTVVIFCSDNGGNAEAGPSGRTKGNPTTADSAWFCGQSWAHLQNTPFRLYKHHNHEGGIATPLIVHWPVGIKSKGWRRQPAHMIDIAPTLIDLAKTTWPDTIRDRHVSPPAGISLAPVIQMPNQAADRSIFWEHEGNAAIRTGDLKLVRNGVGSDWELYDITNDRTESNDLSSSRRPDVDRLSQLWSEWAEQSNVLPAPARFQP
ncbi:arylsulfatase [Pirellulimonas nuda]|nr:arylsulfatase [Pirellulimonas nuda]